MNFRERNERKKLEKIKPDLPDYWGKAINRAHKDKIYNGIGLRIKTNSVIFVIIEKDKTFLVPTMTAYIENKISIINVSCTELPPIITNNNAFINDLLELNQKDSKIYYALWKHREYWSAIWNSCNLKMGEHCSVYKIVTDFYLLHIYKFEPSLYNKKISSENDLNYKIGQIKKEINESLSDSEKEKKKETEWSIAAKEAEISDLEKLLKREKDISSIESIKKKIGSLNKEILTIKNASFSSFLSKEKKQDFLNRISEAKNQFSIHVLLLNNICYYKRIEMDKGYYPKITKKKFAKIIGFAKKIDAEQKLFVLSSSNYILELPSWCVET